QLTSPATDPVYVHVKVWLAPPARSNGSTGFGPSLYVTIPAPARMNCGTGTLTAFAAAPPVFVTVTITRMLWPIDAYRGSATARATSAAFVCTVTPTASHAFTAVPAHVTPDAVALNTTAPAPDAEYVHTNVWLAPPAIVSGP